MYCSKPWPSQRAFKARITEVPFWAAAGDLTEHQCPPSIDLVYTK